MCRCSDLIGMPFELGADGTNGKIDCIHLCYIVLDHLGIEAPEFKQSWYESGKYETLRDLLRWGDRVSDPEYDEIGRASCRERV